MKQHYDLCVIGSGPAGQKAAIQAAKLGKSVCVVERREVVGGVSINTGTIPSKALREAILRMVGRQSAMPREADLRGAREKAYADLLSSAQSVIRAEIDIVDDQFRRNEVCLIHGQASFKDARTVTIQSAAGDHEITADFFVVAVGTRPARGGGIPFDGTSIITSDELLKLPALPRSMIIVGGGVIGTEYASMLAAMGVRITLIEGRPGILEFVDDELTESLQYHLRQDGMTLRLGEKVVKVTKTEAPPGRGGNDLVEAMLESAGVHVPSSNATRPFTSTRSTTPSLRFTMRIRSPKPSMLAS